MSGAHRLEYLERMGLQSWVLRRQERVSTESTRVPTETTRAQVQPVTGRVAEHADTREVSREWEVLRGEVAACTACALAAGRTQTVFGVGDIHARCMVIGEAPGAEEDRRGEPFVGPAGELLNAMLRALGFEREQVFIANVVKCRPPGNRDPTPAEAHACSGFLHRQIALVRPTLLLAVGRIAAHNLLGNELPMGRLRQKVHRFGPEGLPVLVTYHPGYLLRSPAEKRKVWEDLKMARRMLEHGGSAS